MIGITPQKELAKRCGDCHDFTTQESSWKGSTLLVDGVWDENFVDWVEIPYKWQISHYLQAFSTMLGGWEWDFWTINSISYEVIFRNVHKNAAIIQGINSHSLNHHEHGPVPLWTYVDCRNLQWFYPSWKELTFKICARKNPLFSAEQNTSDRSTCVFLGLQSWCLSSIKATLAKLSNGLKLNEDFRRTGSAQNERPWEVLTLELCKQNIFIIFKRGKVVHLFFHQNLFTTFGFISKKSGFEWPKKIGVSPPTQCKCSYVYGFPITGFPYPEFIKQNP